MPFLDWVNKNQAKDIARDVPYHLLKQESVHGDVAGANADNMIIQGDNCRVSLNLQLCSLNLQILMRPCVVGRPSVEF